MNFCSFVRKSNPIYSFIDDHCPIIFCSCVNLPTKIPKTNKTGNFSDPAPSSSSTLGWHSQLLTMDWRCYRISRGINKYKCYLRGQLKTMQNFQRWSRKIYTFQLHLSSSIVCNIINLVHCGPRWYNGWQNFGF